MMESCVLSSRRTSSCGMSWYVRLLSVLYWAAVVVAGIMGDECDWTGSGLTVGTSRVVTPVYLRCGSGRINWLYPRGALRVIMRLHNSNKDFKVCMKILNSSSSSGSVGGRQFEDSETDLYPEDEVLDFREDNYISAVAKRSIDNKKYSNNKEEPFPARLFLEGSRGLVPLYAADDGSGKSVRCFRSKNGQAAIYVEATPENGEMKRSAHLQYDLQPLPAKAYDPATEDCRPCTAQEMAHAFCTSDIVTRGVIVGMKERSELDTSELTIKVTKLIRYVTSEGHIYTADTGAPHNNSSEYQRIKGLFQLEGGDDSVNVGPFHGVFGSPDTLFESHLKGWKDEKTWFTRVQAGAQCGVATGAGEFLITAKRRLGTLALACAPRISEWYELVNKFNDEGTAHCLLTT